MNRVGIDDCLPDAGFTLRSVSKCSMNAECIANILKIKSFLHGF
ncbi:hypothetical protein HCH_00301 [Hahella chejuensis KCTC 2396]|uniref:Uncharacterized protein n=1 Tax=Hahella chejuensis (strain KCTC 2396) TaxID=349521 RepID=Q2SQ61_HAHCH|nr:hypothetical protein HCH_00301 [Hahella chejuensis KCTC 2396]